MVLGYIFLGVLLIVFYLYFYKVRRRVSEVLRR